MNANDPRITAYALGELPAAEQAEVQAALAENAALAAEVDEIRQLASQLKHALGAGKSPATSQATRQAVEAALANGASEATSPEEPNAPNSTPAAAAIIAGKEPSFSAWPRNRRGWLAAALATAVAACIGGLVWFYLGGRGLYDHTAMTEPKAATHRQGFTQESLNENGVRVHGLTPDMQFNEHRPFDAERDQNSSAPRWNFRFENGRSFSGSLNGDELRSLDDSAPADHLGLPTSGPTGMPRILTEGVDDRSQVLERHMPFPTTEITANPSLGEPMGSVRVVDPTSRSEAVPDSVVPSQEFGRPDVNNGGFAGRPGAGGEPGGPAGDAPVNVPTSVWPLEELDEVRALTRLNRFGKDNAGEGKEAAPARTWRRAEATPNASRLMIGEHEELPLQAVQANVEIDGFRARVLLDCYFYNDRAQQFEGTFKIRLPNEASLYFFAFGETIYKSPEPPKKSDPVFFSVERTRELGTDPKEIMRARSETWKEPKEARVVPKEKAAHAYRETVRRRVDPALVEWAGAGVFSARVFPLAPQTLHRIVIGYDMNLLEVGDDLVYQLDLPRDVPQKLVDLHVTSLGKTMPLVAPEVKPTLVDGRLHYHFDHPEIRGVELRLPQPGGLMLTGRDAEVGNFFAARFRVPGESGNLPADSARQAKEAVFLLDTSLTAAPDRFNIYLELMQAILRENRDRIDSFQVQFFNVHSHSWKSEPVKNTAENAAAAVEYAQTLALEGATDLGQALRFCRMLVAPPDKQPGARSCDLFLLSDGSATWGAADLATLTDALPPGCTLFAYTTGMAGDDTPMLAQLAQASGGALFSVVGQDALPRAATAHRSRPWQLNGVSLDGGSDMVIAGRPRVVYPGQTLLIAGRGEPTAATVSLLLEQAGEQETQSIALASLASDLAPRVYGQVATGGLEDLQPATEDVAVAYARHFRVPGQTCSLLMLETEQDYLRFNIKPEEDAFVVQSTLATEAMRSAEVRAEELRRSPKAAFLAYFDRLTKMPGMQWQLSPALRIAAESLDDDAYRLSPRPLNAELIRWRDLPSGYQDETLSARPLAYAAVVAEAQRRFAAAGPDDALKALSSLIELNPGDAVLARDVAYSAMEWGRGDQAYDLFRRVAYARPYEPQTYLALAQCLASAEKTELAMLYYELAITGGWDSRFGEFTQIAALDYLRLLSQIERGDVTTKLSDFAKARRRSLEANYSVGQPDLVVAIAWNTDGTDVDLHVIEPTGEECYYSHRDTRIGGHMTADVTQGFGPEMYVLRKAISGEYKIRAKYFSSDANRASTRTRVFATIYRHWGTPQEVVERRTITLESGKEMHDLAKMIVK